MFNDEHGTHKRVIKRRYIAFFCAAAMLFSTLLSTSELFSRSQFAAMSTTFGKNDDVTVMIYMCASDLESEDGSATDDILEMLSADIPSNVRVVIQTGGTLKWHRFKISSEHSQRYVIADNQLVLVDDTLPQLDMTAPETLEDFVSWSSEDYPAKRNILLFWGHGGGAVEGYGYDEFQEYSASLTLDEMRGAILSTGVFFDFIGFDTCLMGGLETAYALRESANYLLASEDFESGYGWDYKRWLETLGKDTSVDTVALTRILAEDFLIESQKNDAAAVLALVDLYEAENLYEAWKNFAYTAPRASLIPRITHATSTARYPLGDTMASCGITDLLEAAKKANTSQANKLIEAAESAIIFRSASAENADMCGLSVTLPFLTSDFYPRMKSIYLNCGIDAEYVSWLAGFSPHHIKSAA